MGNDVSMIKEYREKIGSELSKICDDMLNLLDSRLIPSASSAESKVFYLKMKGDYHTYLSEFKSGEEKRKVAGSTLRAYNSAQDIALAELPPVNPLRLRLALNFSVFYYKVLKKPNLTRNLAKQAFDEATSELHTLAEESYKETAYFMQPLHDNVKLWTSQGQQ